MEPQNEMLRKQKGAKVEKNKITTTRTFAKCSANALRY